MPILLWIYKVLRYLKTILSYHAYFPACKVLDSCLADVVVSTVLNGSDSYGRDDMIPFA